MEYRAAFVPIIDGVLWTALIHLTRVCESGHSPALFPVARIGLCDLVAWLVTSVKAAGHE